MNRSERWNTSQEIKQNAHEASAPGHGAGPVVYVENGHKYCDDGESHISLIGRSGTGKTQCGSLPFGREVLLHGESLIALDPKGECYQKNACFIPDNYQVFCINFRNPRQSPTCWNPLSMIYRLYCSENPEDRDNASTMLSELWTGVYPYVFGDPFWQEAAANYGKGLTYGLFESAPPSQISLNSVSTMMEQSDIRFGGQSVLNTFYDLLPANSLAKKNLATYSTAPNETRGSIHSVAASGLEIFSRSPGLTEMLSQDTLNILDLDVNRPFALFIIVPDETNAYDALAGLLVTQMAQHLIRVAQDLGGRLPIRVNFILEELGSIGKSIPSLPNLMVASRSRNMRLMLVLQSNNQLVDVYGESKAEVIRSCIGTTIGFSTNNWETLIEWSQRCGERQTLETGTITKEPLITPAQLAAMPIATALVLLNNRLKFIAHFPFYNQLYDNTAWAPPTPSAPRESQNSDCFDLLEFVKAAKKKQLAERLNEMEHKDTPAAPAKPSPDTAQPPRPSWLLDFDSISPETEKKGEKGAAVKTSPNIILWNIPVDREKIAKIIADFSKESTADVLAHLSQSKGRPVHLSFPSKRAAGSALKKLAEAGVLVTYE